MWNIVAVFAALSVTLTALTPQGDRLEFVGRLPPFDFAIAVLGAGIPAGIEVHRGDDAPSRMPADTEMVRFSAVELTAAFNAAHQSYAASLADGVVVVRPAAHRASALDRPATPPRRIVLGLAAAQRAVLSVVDAELLGPSAGSTIGSSPADRGDDLQIALDGHTMPLIDHLNRLVRQSKRQGWMMVTEEQSDGVALVQFGLLFRGGFSTRAGFSVAVR